MAVNVEAVQPVPRRLAPRQGHLVADDRRPQADRDPLHLDVARLLRGRRHPRAADAHAARDAERALPDEELLQRGRHDPRDDDDLPRHRPDPRRLRELPRAADDRRARHGVPAPERALVLALPARRDRPLRSASSRRAAPARARLDGVRAALDAALAGQRPGPLDPRRCTSSRSRRSSARSTSS